MLKYLTHKLRTQSINEDNNVQEKIDGHDSGTESDGDLDPEEDFQPEPDIELTSILLGSAESKSNGDNFRIIEGAPVKSGQYPFLVSIQYYGQHFCGGSIISEKVILTAAHCLKGKSAEHMTIVAGTHDIESGSGVTIAASRIAHHWGFNFEKTDDDIGVIFLSSPLKYSSTIQPAELSSEDSHESQDYATIAGWGTTYKGGRPTTVARYTKIPLWGRLCLNYIPRLTRNQICAGEFDGQKNSCPGDSGGPLFKGNTIIGTVSYGFGCGTYGAPAVYASVADLRPWILANAHV